MKDVLLAGYTNHEPTPEKVPVMIQVQNHRLDNGNDDRGGTGEGNCDLEIRLPSVQLCLGHFSCPAETQREMGNWKEVTSLPRL